MKGLSNEKITELLAGWRGARTKDDLRLKRNAQQQLAADKQNRRDESAAKEPIRTDDPRFPTHSELSSGDV